MINNSWNRNIWLCDTSVIIASTVFLALVFSRRQMTHFHSSVGIASGTRNRKRNGFINDRNRHTPVGQRHQCYHHSTVEVDYLRHRFILRYPSYLLFTSSLYSLSTLTSPPCLIFHVTLGETMRLTIYLYIATSQRNRGQKCRKN